MWWGKSKLIRALQLKVERLEKELASEREKRWFRDLEAAEQENRRVDEQILALLPIGSKVRLKGTDVTMTVSRLLPREMNQFERRIETVRIDPVRGQVFEVWRMSLLEGMLP